MKVQILGTAGAEAWPALFCGCDTCNRARAAGGKDLRSRSTVQIDDYYKIDLSPDLYYHIVRFGIDLSKLRHLFITHSHEDHLAPGQLDYLAPGFTDHLHTPPVRIHGNGAVAKALEWLTNNPVVQVEMTELEPFRPVQADHLTFTPVPVDHKAGEQCYNYVVQSGDATLLYGCDTKPYSDELLDQLSDFRFDLLILECTKGLLKDKTWPHMGFWDVLRIRDRLAASGALKADGRVVLTHLAHGIGMLHEEIEAAAQPEGLIVAYDGLIIDL